MTQAFEVKFPVRLGIIVNYNRTQKMQLRAINLRTEQLSLREVDSTISCDVINCMKVVDSKGHIVSALGYAIIF